MIFFTVASKILNGTCDDAKTKILAKIVENWLLFRHESGMELIRIKMVYEQATEDDGFRFVLTFAGEDCGNR